MKLNAFTKEFKSLLRAVNRGYYNAFYKKCENVEVAEALIDVEFHLCETVYCIDKPVKGELRKPEKVRALAEFIKKYGNKGVVDKFKTDMKQVAYPDKETHKWTQIALDIIGEF